MNITIYVIVNKMKKISISTTITSQINRYGDNEFDPKTRDDLAVHRNRVKEISNWLDQAISSPTAVILLLTGPAGCGKTALVKVLAKEKYINIIDWVTPVDTNEMWSSGGTDWSAPVSVAVKFNEFLKRAGRYSSVILEKSKGKKLVLMEDFPSSFISSPDEFRQTLESYVIYCNTPVVFICTDSVNKKSTDIAYELFPESFKQKLNIIHIAMLAIAQTSMVKALRRVVQMLNRSSIFSEEVIVQVAEESNGDIRRAINDIRIKLIRTDSVKKRSEGIKGRGKRKQDCDTSKKNKSHKSENGNETIGLFHSVGRVLYAKREISSDARPTIFNEKASISYFKADPRGELLHKPMDIVDQYGHYARKFIQLAYGNYLDIFSSIDNIYKAAEYLSQSDVIMSEWREKDILNKVGFSIAVAGLMDSNNDPIRKWKPLRGSEWAEDLRIARTNHDKVKEMFTECRISTSALYADLIPSLTSLWQNHNNSWKRLCCKDGFLPHEGSAMLTTLEKMKLDCYQLSGKSSHSNQTDDGRPDTPIHISDDSD